MKIGDIKPGRWYETKQGNGPCIRSGGTHPPSVQIEVRNPFPRGRITLSPRDVLREIDPPAESKTQE
jgi:hypothetical protein